MSSRTRRLKNILRHVRAGSIIFVVVVLVFTAGLAIFVGSRIHDMRRETLLLRGEVNTQEATMEYDRYLLTRVNIITMVSSRLEGLLASGADSAAVEKYLTEETNIIIATIDPDTTGLYGLINGTYVDGSGWVPDADYEPTERPWYRETQPTEGQITFVDPYVDAQTNTVMLTVSKLLNDGESVLAMDVSLQPIQEMVENVAASTQGGQAYLMDENGNVIVHSDREQLEKNYLEEPDSLYGKIARRLLVDKETQFEVNAREGNYTVYTHELEGGWYSISLIDRDEWQRPMLQTMIIFAVILGLVVFAIIYVFLRMSAKNAALQELHHRVDQEEKRGEELQALSETDRMTALFDRVSAERKVNEMIGNGSGGMFLELDIDRFKEINDTYGHQTGDAVILAIADALRNTFRTNDITMRLGGDEFGVYAMGIPSQEMGESMVHRLFGRIDALDIPEMNGEKVHVSVGAVLIEDGKEATFHDLYAVADEALYISKAINGNSLTFGPDVG